MRPMPLAQINEIAPYKGGESKLPGFDKPIKLSSNENPLGCSPLAQAAYVEAAGHLASYPDGNATALKVAIGRKYGIASENLICGAGSDEIFTFIARAFLAPGDEIIQSEFGFLVYRLVAQQSGAIVKTAPDRDFTVDVDAMLALVTPKTRIVFLANPNNPTGTFIPVDDVRRLHAGLRPDILLVIDAAYAEYVRRNDYSSGQELVAANQNVMMTRTFSKIHGLASARLGWAYAPVPIIEALDKVRGPFNVTGPALAAGVAALEDEKFAADSADHNDTELAIFVSELTAMGFELTPSVGNFVLVHFDESQDRGAKAADAFLRSRGLIVRAVGAYGLPNALRVSIGTHAENAAVIDAFREFADQ
jgi:histidinol-phosphate aminotransferase